jgi:hypothetical protein
VYTDYSILIHTEKGRRGVEPERREGKHRKLQIPELGGNTNMTETTQEIGYFKSINSDKL